MNKNKIIIFFLLMVAAHVAHIFEEVWGRFWILDKIGLGLYLVINLLLLCIPLLLFYFVINNKRWAFILSIIYAGFMGLQGIGHNLAVIITNRYFDGFAGGFTGIVMTIISPWLIYYLFKGFRLSDE
jgi:hypothetical protein